MSLLQSFGENIWIADGPPVSAFGPVTLPTRMIVARLHEGSVWINSPIEPSHDVVEQVKAIGPIRYLVAPTPLHVWRLKSWNKLLPHAELWGPEMLGDEAPAAWAAEIEQVVFRGNAFFDETEFFHKPSRTLMITDFVQNYPAVDGDALGNFAKTLGGVLDGGVPRDIRWSLVDRHKARNSLAKMLSWDFDKVIVAHGGCVRLEARAFVENAFRWLVT